MRVALDFDGVVCDPNLVRPGGRMGAPMAGALEGIQQLLDDGHAVIIHSVRSSTILGHGALLDWLEYMGVSRAVDVWARDGKPQADLYVDNNGWRFEEDGHGWPELLAWSADRPDPSAPMALAAETARTHGLDKAPGRTELERQQAENEQAADAGWRKF